MPVPVEEWPMPCFLVEHLQRVLAFYLFYQTTRKEVVESYTGTLVRDP